MSTHPAAPLQTDDDPALGLMKIELPIPIVGERLVGIVAYALFPRWYCSFPEKGRAKTKSCHLSSLLWL